MFFIWQFIERANFFRVINFPVLDNWIRGDTKTGRRFAAFYLREGKLLAVDAVVNSPKAFMACRKALTDGSAVNIDMLADESIDIKEAFAS